MRKIYSLVLMAVMLLVGTTVNAATLPVANWSSLNNAFRDANSGDTIKLTSDVTQEAALVLSDNRTLTLDLNSCDIDFSLPTPTTKLKKPWNLEITHGKLSIVGNGAIRNNIHGNTSYKHNSKEIIVARLYGSTNQTDSAWSVLEVAQGVGMYCTDSGKVAINIDQVIDQGNKTHAAFGTIVKFDGKCYGKKYGIQLSGNVDRIPYKDGTDQREVSPGKAYFPYIHIQSHAEVMANPTDNEAVGAYAAGYGEWLIEGYVHGSTGVYVKGGKIDINDATITSDNNVDSGVYSSQTSGVNAGGNAIATESNGTYAGSISVTISGDSKITAGEKGYAIQDTTTTATESTLESVVISGGTFKGGAEGCITIDVPDGEDAPQIELTGGTFTGDIQTLIENIDSDKIIESVVATDGEGNATVVIGTVDTTDVVVKPEKNVMPTVAILDTADVNSIIKLDADTAGGDIDLVLTNADAHAKYISINGSSTNTAKITIPLGKKLTVEQIIMNAYGQIVVEAGAQLIITGANGLFADVESNLVLEANETAQALFVIAPTVGGNKQPKATVRYYTTACGATSSNIKWQRLTSPLSTFGSIASNASTLSPTLVPGASTFLTWIQTYDESMSSWVDVPANQMKAYISYAITNNSLNGGITYTFKGNVQGNVANDIQLTTEGWNYMGNPFIAPMHVKAFLQAIATEPVDGTIWLWNNDNQKYEMKNSLEITAFADNSIPEISALKTFIVKRTSAETALLDIDYANTVYNYAVNPGAYEAPQRIDNSLTSIKMHIEAANGESDDLYIVEGSDYSDEYENGADAFKYMNAGLNFFAASDENYAMVATDNVEGTLISMTTADEIDYTITFSNVRGEVYALRDNLTNAVVLMNEGATYNFTAQSNANIDGRFQIVGRQEMPTAVETVEEMVNTPKAIYTVMGQYVGVTTDWNNLPAGVYVVDGVKVIK